MRQIQSPARGGSINERIGRVYSSLSKYHKKTVDYVVANAFRAATMSIDELAHAVGISNATANRFARALGFDGYPQFRAELVHGFESMMAPAEKLEFAPDRPPTCADIFARCIEEGVSNLEATRRILNPENCERAVKMILNAERIFIIGYGASSFLGGLMGHALAPLCKSVHYNLGSGGAGHIASQLFKYTENDLVIGISFPQYASDTITLLRQVRENHVPIIALTDVPSSPVAQLANLTLYGQTQSSSAASSDGAALCLIEALCNAVAYQTKLATEERSEMDQFLMPWVHHNQQLLNRRS